MDTALSLPSSRLDKLFPTIDRSFLTNDGYQDEKAFLDIDYQEADYGSDLDLADPSCEKGSQHEEFIDIDDFSLDSLPDIIQHPSVVVWVRYSAQLVVRLSRRANATGRVFVIKDHVRRSYPCKKERCDHNVHQNNHIVHGGLGIITNKHVVKSDLEAKTTKVEFFYHNNERRLNEVVKEYGHSVHVTNHNLDYTMFTCNMHDCHLLQRIQLCSDISTYAWRKIPEYIRRHLKTIAIVISHPHGTSKKVSIGSVLGKELRNDSEESVTNQRLLKKLYESCERNESLQRFAVYLTYMRDIPMTVRVTYYDAATCPGSSGAPVYMGNAFLENGEEVNPPHTHRGRHPVNGFNNCYT